MCPVWSHKGQALKGPVLDLMLCCHHLEILTAVSSRGLVFLFFTASHKVHHWCWLFEMIVKSSLFHFQSQEPCYSLPQPKRKNAIFFAQRCLQLPHLCLRVWDLIEEWLGLIICPEILIFPLNYEIMNYRLPVILTIDIPELSKFLPLAESLFWVSYTHFHCLGYFQWGKLQAI